MVREPIMKTNHDDSSMPEKLKKQPRQMALRESDDRILPKRSADQTEGDKPSSIGVGKAVGITRGPDWAPFALSSGTTVQSRSACFFGIKCSRRKGGQESKPKRSEGCFAFLTPGRLKARQFSRRFAFCRRRSGPFSDKA